MGEKQKRQEIFERKQDEMKGGGNKEKTEQRIEPNIPLVVIYIHRLDF